MKNEIDTFVKIKNLKEDLKNGITGRNLDHKVILFTAESGTIFHNFFDNLYNEIKNEAASLDIYTDFMKDDEINLLSNKMWIKNIFKSVSLSVSNISLGIEKQANDKYESLLDNQNDILFMIKHWELDSHDIRELIRDLIRNNEAFEKYYNKKIYLFIFLNEDNIFENIHANLIHYYFKRLNSDDAKTFLTIKLCDSNINFEHLPYLYEIAAGNIHSIELLLNKVNTSELETDIKLFIKSVIKELRVNFKANDKLSIILDLISVMPEHFDPFILNDLDEINSYHDIDLFLELTTQMSLVYEVDKIYYCMINEIKKYILEEKFVKKTILISQYYALLKKVNPISYLERAILLNDINREDESLELAVLALELDFHERNIQEMNEIRHKINGLNFNDENKQIFNKIFDGLISRKDKYQDSIYDSFETCYLKSNIIKSVLLKNDILYLSQTYTVGNRLKTHCTLLTNIIKEFNNQNDELIESFHLATCIMILLPNLLDKFNDSKTYDELNTVLQTFSHHKVVKENLEFYENVKLRKSFMECTIEIAINNYNSALSYFNKIGDVDEKYMTLSGLIGLYTIIKDFDKADNASQEIEDLRTQNSNKIFESFYKTKNNRIILDFFRKEPELSVPNVKDIIKQLLALIDQSNDVSASVIYTNVCSLYLYIDNIPEYEITKKKIETLECVSDISDLKDEEIDDFYPYYFAWFEMCKFIMVQDYDEAKKIYKELDGFIPTIFKQEKSLLNKKHMAFVKVFNNKNICCGKELANYVINNTISSNKAWHFFGRTLMLSDLQHTSLF